MDIFHSEQEKQREIAAYEEKKAKRVKKGKIVLRTIAIWDAFFAIAQCFSMAVDLPFNLLLVVYLFILLLHRGGIFALDFACLNGFSWARNLRAILAIVTIVFGGVLSFLYYFMNGNFIMMLYFIGEFVICMFLFGSRSVQKYIEVKGKAR